METASRYGSKPNAYSAAIAEDVSVEVKMDGEGPRMGADAKLSILVKNLSSSPRRTTLHSQVAVMYYTGVLKGAIKKEQLPVELLANEGWFSPMIFCNFKCSKFFKTKFAPPLKFETIRCENYCWLCFGFLFMQFAVAQKKILFFLKLAWLSLAYFASIHWVVLQRVCVSNNSLY